MDMGPVEYYKDDSINVYEFSNFEGYPIYRAEYSPEKGLLESGRLLYYVSEFRDYDDRRRIKVFLYLISPPGKSLTYRLFDSNAMSKDTSLIDVFDPNKQKFTIFYLDLPKQEHKYFFEIEAYYSNSGKQVKNILDSGEGDFIMPKSR